VDEEAELGDEAEVGQGQRGGHHLALTSGNIGGTEWGVASSAPDESREDVASRLSNAPQTRSRSPSSTTRAFARRLFESEEDGVTSRDDPRPRAGSARVVRGSGAHAKGDSSARKARNLSADVHGRRRRAASFERPPSRQKDPFPTNLAELQQVKRDAFATQGKQQPDVFAAEQQRQARKVRAQCTPPCR